MKDGTFTADRLIALYDRVAEAGDAIPRLRRFVLDLAVRGKLVEQDPSDEPAAELLKRIAKEKARLAKAGIIRKPKTFETVEDVPFALPGTWAWSRIREVTTDRGQKIPNARFTYIDVSAINKDAGVIEAPTVLDPGEAPSRARKVVSKGDVIYSCVRPYLLNVAVVEQEIEPAPIASTAFAIVNGMGLIHPRFIWIVLRSPFMVTAVEQSQRGQAYPAINDADFAVLPFPLPPLAEQQRIVTKVDELMALCDQLEAARAGREAVRDRLTAVTLSRLTAPETDAETFPTHARFALQSLPTLTTRPDQIKTLRQTILNLAVRGKLVEQDLTDEPAAELLKRIAREKDRLFKAGETGPLKVAPALEESDLPFVVPQGWAWTQLSSIGVVSPRVRADDTDVASFVSMSMIPAELRAPHTHEVRRWGEIKKGYTTFAEGDVGLAKITPCFENGKSTVFRGLAGGLGAGTTELHVVRPVLMSPDYILLFLKSPMFVEAGIPRMTGTAGQKRVPTEYFSASPFPLPPLAEQHRIVAKVDALMALCDKMEASLTTATTTRSRLLEATLHAALARSSQVA
ncbi:restriction endonuclease subunit S [Paracoccus marcusii]|uniref:restriction endonuclease subunit S n=1 Tax=Paracoccus marcusii TaxID=59779 RepID=UPI0032655945